MSDDLVTWLNVQLDEDEADALDAIKWEDPRFTGHAYTWMLTSYLRGKVKRQHVIPGAPSPRRVLALVAALRQILAEFSWEAQETRAIRILGEALYADRPGYRDEWRP